MAARTDVLDDDQMAAILALEEVHAAKQTIDAQSSGSVYFTVDCTDSIQSVLKETFGLELPSAAAVPMRWIKGDTKAHVDVGAAAFDTTHLLYLTDSPGLLVVDGECYPITKGSAYSFPESSRHETIHTGSEPRLLLGPMSEEGFAVGGSTTAIMGEGGTTVYIRQDSGNYQYSSNEGGPWSPFFTPTIVTNINTSAGIFTLEFISDISFTNANNYFICGSSDIQFGSTSLNNDGSRPVFTINGVSGYPGLIQNGTSGANGQSNIYVYNLVLAAANGSTLTVRGGWIGQEYFGKTSADNYIVNCSSTGPISANGGGIVGFFAGSGATASLSLIGCSSSGSIGDFAGGIGGLGTGFNSGSVICDSCWSTGLIGGSGGGILGASATGVTITNCYSTGAISSFGGGICGTGCGNVFIIGCYSVGSIGQNAGGIVGDSSTYTSISNCYSVGGMVGMNAGGIVGSGASAYDISYCYTLWTGSQGYIIAGSSSIPSSCYSEASWNSTTANTVLEGFPSPIIGTTWVDVSAGSPYELFNMGYTPYTTANITATPSLNRIRSATIIVGASTAAAIVSGKDYTLLDISGGDIGSYASITMDADTGVISTTGATAPGTYTIYLRNTGSYNITEYQLTVTGGGGTYSCCDRPTFTPGPGVGYDTYTDIRVGNILIETVQRRPLSYDQLMTIRKAQSSKK